MKVETMLHDEILNEFEELKKLEVGSDGYRAAVDGISKLLDRAIEYDKLDAECNERSLNRGFEEDYKLQLAEDEKRDRRIKNGITIAGIVIPSVITIWGTIKALNVEKEGTVTTIMGRGFINKLLPKK